MTYSTEAGFKKWNEDRERQISAMYDGAPLPSRHSSSSSSVSKGRDPLMELMKGKEEEMAFAQRGVDKEIALIQKDITVWVFERASNNPFEARWLSATQERRRGLLEKALFTVTNAPGLSDSRLFAPECRVNKLLERGGRGYIDLLHQVFLERPMGKDEYPLTPVLVPNARFELVLLENAPGTSKAAELVRSQMTQSRNYFISLFCWEILLSFDGKSQTYVPVKTGSSKHQKADAALLNHFDKEMGTGAGKKIQEEVKLERKAADRCCDYCRKLESLIGDGKKLQVCGACQKIGRSVRYCSRECQVKDFKEGGHKKICGKPLSSVPTVTIESDPLPPTKSSRDDIEPPDPGYKRSPALLAQIKALEEEAPTADYVLFLPDPAPANFAAIFSDPVGRIFFNLMRSRAFKNGDRQAVSMMYKQLEDMSLRSVSGHVLGKEGLKKQLASEFRVDMDQLLKEYAPGKNHPGGEDIDMDAVKKVMDAMK